MNESHRFSLWCEAIERLMGDTLDNWECITVHDLHDMFVLDMTPDTALDAMIDLTLHAQAQEATQ